MQYVLHFIQLEDTMQNVQNNMKNTSNNMDSISYNTQSTLTRFHNWNRQLQLRLNVFGYNDEDGLEPFPYFVSSRPETEPEVIIL